jgi:hypothetical protein
MDYLTRTWVKGQPSTGIVETLSQIRNPGNRHVYCGAIKTFRSRGTSAGHMKGPRFGKLIISSLTQEEVPTLLERAHNARDEAIFI